MWVAPHQDWTPFDLPYLIGWNTNRSLQGFSIGDNRVSNWRDSSMSGNTLTSGSGGADERPDTATSSNFGGKTVAVFDTSDSKQMILSPPPSALRVNLGDFFFAIAFRFSAPGGGTSMICSAQKQSENNQIRLSLVAAGQPQFKLGNGGTVTGDDSVFDTTTLMVATRVSGTISLFINGVSVGTPLSGTLIDIDGSNTLRLGATDLGGAKGVTGFPTGEIAEFIYGGSSSTGVIKDFDRQRLEGYLAHEVGISSVLPSSHPYKHAPPKRAR